MHHLPDHSDAGQRRAQFVGPIGLAVGLLVLLGGLVVVLAPPLGLGRAPFLGVGLALRLPLTVGVAVAALIGVGLCWLRALRRHMFPVTAALVVVALVGGITLGVRGLSVETPAEVAAGQVRILSWNVNGDLVLPGVIAGLAAQEHADLVVIPDANIAQSAADLGRAFVAAGYGMTLFASDSRSAELAVFVKPGLAEQYRAQPGPDPDATLVLTPNAPGVPLLVALHAPQPGLRSTAPWSSALNWVERECSTRTAVAVGDFNATVDNFGSAALGGCRDAAIARRSGAVATWPTSMPTWLGMPIDHVLTGDAWRVVSFTVITSEDGSGARHRPILAVLTPAG